MYRMGMEVHLKTFKAMLLSRMMHSIVFYFFRKFRIKIIMALKTRRLIKNEVNVWEKM